MRRLVPGLILTVLLAAAMAAHAAPTAPARRGAAPVRGVVNLNQAALEQLTLLPGVGPAKARRIIEYRARHPFKRIEELTRVKGFGRTAFARLKVHLTVSGPTTIQRAPAAAPAAAARSAPRAAGRTARIH